jgi:protein SFI1
LRFIAFGVWRARTKILPAMQLYAFKRKAECWRIWRTAMPAVLQLRAARDLDRKNVLGKRFFGLHRFVNVDF